MQTQKFSDAQYMTGAEKALALRQWKSFLKALANADLGQLEGADYGYYPRALEHIFTDRLYKHLSSHCGFIAHYNRRGFISARFTRTKDILSSFGTIRERRYFGGYSDYADLGAAMVEALDAAPVKKAFAARWARERAAAEDSERAELARLKAKYPEEKSFGIVLPFGAAAPKED